MIKAIVLGTLEVQTQPREVYAAARKMPIEDDVETRQKSVGVLGGPLGAFQRPGVP